MLARNIHAVPTPQPTEPAGSQLPSWSLLDEAAAAAGISPAHCLLSQAAVLAGISGSDAAWSSTRSRESLGQVSLVLPADSLCLRQHIDRIMGFPWTLQELLHKRSAQLRVEILQLARFGCSGRSPKLKSDAIPVQTLHDHRTALLLNEIDPAFSIKSVMDADISQAVFHAREEALLRPFFILRNVPLKGLKAALQNCHNREALVMGSVEDLIPLQAGRRTMSLDRLLGAIAVQPPKAGMLQPAGRLDFVRATGILMEATREQLTAIQQKVPGALEPFILPGSDTVARAPDSNANAREWHEHTCNAIRRIVDHRRQGTGWQASMHDAEKSVEFERRCLDFTRELESQQGAASFRQFTGLPLTLAWTISVFHHQKDCDDLILKFALPTARLLLHEHRRNMLQVAPAFLHGQQAPLVVRMVRRVKELAPVTDRNLVRGFNNQRMSEHRPMIHQLVSNDILRRDPDDKLILGSNARGLLDRQEFRP